MPRGDGRLVVVVGIVEGEGRLGAVVERRLVIEGLGRGLVAQGRRREGIAHLGGGVVEVDLVGERRLVEDLVVEDLLVEDLEVLAGDPLSSGGGGAVSRPKLTRPAGRAGASAEPSPSLSTSSNSPVWRISSSETSRAGAVRGIGGGVPVRPAVAGTSPARTAAMSSVTCSARV